MTKTEIRKADAGDKDSIAKLYDALIDSLEAGENFAGWRKNLYPTEQTAIKGIAAGDMYVLTMDGRVAASVILNSVQPETYNMADWRVDAAGGEVLVIHTLTVHPDYAGKGAASRFLEFAETLARERGAKTVRLDTSHKNVPAATLYEKRGYTLIGEYPLGFDESMHKLFKCYEKAL